MPRRREDAAARNGAGPSTGTPYAFRRPQKLCGALAGDALKKPKGPAFSKIGTAGSGGTRPPLARRRVEMLPLPEVPATRRAVRRRG